MILDEVVIRFDGSIVEICYAGRADTGRFHIAHIVRVELLRLDSGRGPTFSLDTQQRGGVALTHLKFSPAKLPELQALVAEINAAIP